MSIELYPSIAKIKRNGVYENLPGFVPETGSVATQQMIATAESSNVAQYAHNKGEYFRLNDTLYQAIVKINVGDNIVVGTNCQVAVIGNDLTNVANSIANYELGIATSSHSIGDYFFVNDVLYVATAEIQTGDSISTSTNCRKVVLADELSGQIDDIREPSGVNLFNVDTVKNSVFLNSTTGAEESNPTYNASDFIAATASTSYTIRTFTYSGVVSYRIYFYKSDKSFINRTTARIAENPNGFVFTTPANTAYIRLNFETTANVSGMQDEETTTLVVGNTTIPSYIPYYTAYDRTARRLITNLESRALSWYSATGITDADDITEVGYYYLSTSNVANLPETTGAWYLWSVKLDNNNKLQLAYSARGTNPYLRAQVLGTWSEWEKISLQSTALTRNSNVGITDADDVTEIGYSYVSTSSVDNLPETTGAWYLWTVKLDNSNKLQLAYNARGTNPYLRAQVLGTWSEWEKIGTEAADNIMDNSIATSSISLFPSVGCCGDSFTAGYLYNKPESQWYDPDYVPNGEYPAIGYPAVMGRLYGVDVTAYAKGGLTTTAYRTDSAGLPALLADDPKYLYIIALGLNDKTQEIPLGVEADIDTEPATATYLGNMGAIIRAIQNHAPYARIILCKSLWMNTTYYNYISDGVELLSSHLDMPYIETKDDPFFESDYYINGLKGLHPTAPLYAGIGKRIGELVGKCVIENPDYFYNFYVPNE